MIILNDVLGYNRKIYQDKNHFSFTLDSVLLANFVKVNLSDKKILDIGSGTGAIPLIISLNTKAQIDAIEIQKDVAKMLEKSVEYNNLQNQIKVINSDVMNYYMHINNYYDVIVSNPPYFKNSPPNYNNSKAIAKHEDNLTLDNLIKVSKKMLKNNGRFVIIYDSNRFFEVLKKLEQSNLIPKKIMFVHTKLEKKSNVFLVESIKNGKPGMKILPPFVLYDKNKETEEYSKIINGGFFYESEKL